MTIPRGPQRHFQLTRQGNFVNFGVTRGKFQNFLKKRSKKFGKLHRTTEPTKPYTTLSTTTLSLPEIETCGKYIV